MSPLISIGRNANVISGRILRWDSSIIVAANAKSMDPAILKIKALLRDRRNMERINIPIPMVMSG